MMLLGIYHRGNCVDAKAVQPMVDTLGRFRARYVTRREFPGFWMLSANEVAEESVFAEHPGENLLIGMVGTVVAKGIASSPAATCFATAWKESGTDCLPDLEGAFAAAVYEPAAHRLFLANDKFGMRPIFVCDAGEYVAFCNEIEPLLHLPGFKPSVNNVAVADYFCLGTTLEGETFVAGIRNLLPASLLECSPSTLQVKTYWQPRIPIDKQSTIEEHAQRIAAILQTVVCQTLDQLTNVRCLLSAGADSRLILSCIPPSKRQELPFLTSKLTILDASQDKDLLGATALVKLLGLRHQVLEIALSERDFGPSYFDSVQPILFAKILGGWHGGEFLGGYSAKAAPIRKELTLQEVDEKFRKVFSWRFRWRMKRHPFAHYQSVYGALQAENRTLQFQMEQFGRAFFSTIYNGSRGSWLQPFVIVNQGFSPFWDSRFLQALLRVPLEMLADYRLYNVIFRDCLTELTGVPSNSPLTQRPDTVLAPMTEGIEPKVALKPKYQNALQSRLQDPATWRSHRYRTREMRRILMDGDSPVTMQFIDFETWLQRYLKP